MIPEFEIIQVVAEALGVDPSTLSRQTKSTDVSDWDSLGHIAVIQEIENKFAGKFSSSNGLANALSIEEIIKVLNS